jgi:hypothetical protein
MTRTLPPARRLHLIAAAAVLAVGLALAGPAAAFARTFVPEDVISNANMRAFTSMNANQIQRFLDSKPGVLKSRYFQRNATGSVARASILIYEACQTWKISPKVMLTMLQKEQSLITRRTLASQTLNRAIGAGCPGGPTNKYPGFGNQMWNGARLLDGYGEEGKTTEYVPHPWMPGMANSFTGPLTHTDNIATYKLYVYNPSIGAKAPYGDLSRQSCSGNANFWKIYWAYFGDPFAGTADTTGPLVPPASNVRLAAQYSFVPVGQPVSVTGRLETSPTASGIGAHVRLERLNGQVWVPVAGSEQTVGADGSFAYPLSGRVLEKVRVAFLGSGSLPPAASGLFVSDVGSVLTTPTQVGSASATVAARVTGKVTPAHAGYVGVRVFKMVNGAPVPWKTYTLKTSSTGAWAMSVLLAKGQWKVLASHVCEAHALGFSGLGTVNVR